ncbi:MAG: glutathione S-transferase [Gaiellaceae bacterium]|jgi:glutathione S-transferase|nr:glutathione S-transferase [Gaiellaceae bacterium]
MRLYHQPRSRSVRALWALTEAGADFDLQPISREDKQAPWYRALHPLGQSPVAELDDGPLFESAAIVWTVCDAHPDAGLSAPIGSHARALQYQWSFFAASELEPPLTEIARQLWGEGDPDAEAVAAARARFAAKAAVVAAALDGREFLVDDRFSVADLSVGAVTGFAKMAELAELPDAVDDYVARMEARPALVSARSRQS